MREYQAVIGRLIIAISIVVGACIIAKAIRFSGGTIGSQIASAIFKKSLTQYFFEWYNVNKIYKLNKI